MKRKKRGYLVVALVAMLIAIAVGYAAFSSTLTISGTATASGKWDVKFTSASINTSTHGTAKINTAGDAIDVEVTLGYPGDGCTITANINNAGTIPAKLTGFTLTDADGNAFSNDDITITKPDLKTDGTEIIEAGKTCPVTFGIKWNKDSEKTDEITASFKISFTYEQATEEVTVTPAHGTHT